MEIRIVSLQGKTELEGSSLILETLQGQIQVLESHADMIATVRQGNLSVIRNKAEGSARFYTGDGLLRIQDGDCVLMLDRLLWDTPEGREQAQDRLNELEELSEEKKSEVGLEGEISFLRRFLAQ